MLSKKELKERVSRRMEIDALMKEFDAELKEIDDSLKKEMERRNVEELVVGSNTVRWTSFVQNRFDSSGFKKAHPEMYEEWQKQVSGRRFSVA